MIVNHSLDDLQVIKRVLVPPLENRLFLAADADNNQVGVDDCCVKADNR